MSGGGKPHSKHRQFFIILVQLFIALQVFKLLHATLGISVQLYFLLMFIGFWVLNHLFSKIELARGLDDTLLFKIAPRTTFTNDWFGILTALAIVAGFFFSLRLPSFFLIIAIIAILGYFSYRLIFKFENLLRHSWGLVLLGFIIGMAIGNPFANTPVVIGVFIVAYLVMYVSQLPGEG